MDEMELTYRPRRLRRTPALRGMVREHSLSAADFIYPLFVHEGADIETSFSALWKRPIEGEPRTLDLFLDHPEPTATLGFGARV